MRRAIPAAFLMALAATPSTSAMELFSLGAGSVVGGYYAAARGICEAVNNREAGNLRCSPEPTSGSLYNLTMLREGQLDFAFAQSDWQRFAFEGEAMFAGDAAMPELRSVMALHAETITLLARADAGIESPAGLIGRRIDIGHPASGRHASIRRLLAELGMGPDDFASVSNLTDSLALDELCAGRIDVTVLIVGHPNAAVADAVTRCGATIVPFVGPRIDPVLGASPDFSATRIPPGTYPGVAAVPSYAVIATVVTMAWTDPDTVQAFVRDVLADLDRLRATVPILARLDAAAMRERGLSAPLHDGAARAYADAEEAGESARP